MSRKPKSHDPGNEAPPMIHEADIGSGERTPAEQETEEMIRQVPVQPGGSRQSTTPPAQPGAKQSS
jgi:hypothetical protein